MRPKNLNSNTKPANRLKTLLLFLVWTFFQSSFASLQAQVSTFRERAIQSRITDLPITASQYSDGTFFHIVFNIETHQIAVAVSEGASRLNDDGEAISIPVEQTNVRNGGHRALMNVTGWPTDQVRGGGILVSGDVLVPSFFSRSTNREEFDHLVEKELRPLFLRVIRSAFSESVLSEADSAEWISNQDQDQDLNPLFGNFLDAFSRRNNLNIESGPVIEILKKKIDGTPPISCQEYLSTLFKQYSTK